jgi:hypothetical protein
MQGRPTGGVAASAFKNTILNIDSSRPITANSEDYAGDTLTRITDIEGERESERIGGYICVRI